MKKMILLAAALILALSAASAETIRPKLTFIDLKRLENRMVKTDVDYKGGDTMTLTLYEPERFDAGAIRAAKAGDAIFTDGEEVAIESVTEDGPDILFNAGTASEMLFCDAGYDEFEHVMEDDAVPYLLLGTMECEILEYYPVLDWIDPITGEPQDDPAVYRGDKLKELLGNPEAVGFNCKNVDIVYDRNNQIALMQRYYSPAQ